MNSRTRVEWRNLPSDMLSMIADRSEIRRLRAVCSSWRSSLPLLSTTSPLYSVKIPFRIEQTEALDPNHGMCYTLSERNVYCIEPLVNDISESPKSWIVKLEETSSGKMRLLNTLSNDYGFPDSRDELPDVLNFLNFRVLRVGIEYVLRLTEHEVDDDDDDDDDDVPIKISKVWKVVTSDDHQSILCSFSSKGKLAYYKFGDEKWTVVYNANDKSHYQSDIVFQKQKFYAIYNSSGKIVVVDNDSSLKVEVFVSPVCVDRRYSDSYEWFNYFVKTNGDLFVLKKYSDHYSSDESDDFSMNEMILFKVYRLKEIEKEWVEVTNLGHQTFFASDDCSFAVSTEQFLGSEGNCIYCTDTAFVNTVLDGQPGCDVGIFKLKSNSSIPLRHYRKYCQTFWPIPQWLKHEES